MGLIKTLTSCGSSRNEVDQTNKLIIAGKSHPMPLDKFAEYVSKNLENNGFDREFRCVPLGQTREWKTGKNQKNVNKNRYPTSAAYDHSRVMLKTERSGGTNYINANWVHSFYTPNRYIATQGPLQNTINDFWRMVWQKNAKIIIMLTKLVDDGKVKCDQYWPDDKQTKYGGLKVSQLTSEIFDDHVERKFLIEKGNEKRTVTHYHYLNWPDGSVPTQPSAFYDFLEKIHTNENYHITSSPIVVHCSGGCGRTGTTILIDSMLEMMSKEEYVDVLNHLDLMRKLRVDMVEELSQYVFVHKVLLDALGDEFNDLKTIKIQSHKISDSNLKITIKDMLDKGEMDTEFAKVPLGQTALWRVGKLPRNAYKNRYETSAAYDHSRVVLDLDDDEDEKETDYINANYIHDRDHKNRYIATQGPLLHTINDFWRMVWQKEAKIIIMLTKLVDDGKSKCAKYWPDYSSMFGNHKVSLVDSETHSDLVVRKFHIYKDGADTREVTHYQYLGWPDGLVPETTESFLKLLQQVHANENYKDYNKPIIVHCSGGCGRTGTTILVDSMINMKDEEKCVDLLNQLCQMRTQRVDVVEEPKQYRFAYSALEDYPLKVKTVPNLGPLVEPKITEFKKIVSLNHPIKIENLVITYNTMVSNGHLEKDFNSIALGQTAEWKFGKLRGNRNKNRYSTSAAYDHSRVKLNIDDVTDKLQTDYINANWIDGYDAKQRYIATQGPLPHTVNDFWRMIWQTDARIVVMLTNLVDNGKKKCEKYWPDNSDKFGSIQVSLTDSVENDDSVTRRFRLRNGNKFREVTHYHYLGWPDGGIPAKTESFINFLEEMRSNPEYKNLKSPVVVHCSGGCGRTGTTILTDTMFETSLKESSVNLLGQLTVLRKARVDTVEELDQFKFVHEVLIDFVGLSTLKVVPEIGHEILASKFNDYVNQLIKTNQLKDDFDQVPLGQTAEWKVGKLSGNVSKNRYDTSAAYDHSRVVLKVDNDKDLTQTDYINANWIHSYNVPNRYIATQGPLPNTVEDFWRMVWQSNSEIIVVLTKLVDNGKEKCEKYWPDVKANYGYISVGLEGTEVHNDFVIRKFNLKKGSQIRQINQYHYLSWPDGSVPSSTSSFIALLNAVHSDPNYNKINEPIIVHCSGGCGRTGTTILIDSMLEMIKHEDRVDVLAHLCSLRKARVDTVEEYQQYLFVHFVLMDVLSDEDGEKDPNHLIQFDQIRKLLESPDGRNELKKQFNNLNPVKTSEGKIGRLPHNMNKNRFPSLIPYDNNRVVLNNESKTDKNQTDYINASWIEGYSTENRYIATQDPLVNTVNDFWRMIWESGSQIIIALTSLIAYEQTDSEQYWPDYQEKYGKIKVTSLGTHEVTMRSLGRTFTMEKDSKKRKIRQYNYAFWSEQALPDSKGFAKFLLAVQKDENYTNLDQPIIVHCRSGCGKTGTTILANSLIEVIDTENYVDIYGYLNKIRKQRIGMVEDLSQYIFVHSVLADTLDRLEMKEVPDLSQLIPVSNLVDHARNIENHDDTWEKFDKIPNEQTDDWETGLRDENLDKNHDDWCLPYDHNRVVLNVEDPSQNDYINASWVNGYKAPKRYIVTQMPLPNTFNDFWRMIWQENSRIIVALAVARRCKDYWPLTSGQYGDIEVTLLTREKQPNYFVHKFQLKKERDERTVMQYLFMHRTFEQLPSSEILSKFVKTVRDDENHDNTNKPIVVHCRRGCRRSGSFILVDSMLDMIQKDRFLDPMAQLCQMRRQRVNLASDRSDFISALRTLASFRNPKPNPYPVIPDRSHKISVGSFRYYVEQIIENKHLKMDFDNIPVGQTADWKIGQLAKHVPKNRYTTSAAYDHTKVQMRDELGRINDEEVYINANWIHGYDEPDRYIATQGPLKNTINDFWKMIWLNQAPIIIMLTNLVDNGKSKCEKYWPDDSAKYGDITVTLENTDETGDIVTRTFDIEKDSKHLIVTHYHYLGWPDGSVPGSISSFLDLLHQVHSNQDYSLTKKPVVVHCSGGCGRTGTTILIDIMLNALKKEQFIDFLAHLCLLRKMRVDTVEEYEQYEFAHRVLIESQDPQPQPISSTTTKNQIKSMEDDVININEKQDRLDSLQKEVENLQSREDEIERMKMVELERNKKNERILAKKLEVEAMVENMIELKILKHRYNKIKKLEFEEHVQRMLALEGFRNEFNDVPLGPTAELTAATLPQNRNKNRPNCLGAYDHSRVKLDVNDRSNSDQTDYINASWIDGPRTVRRYIAAQGPISITVEDFWRMIWQNNSKIVLMMTNLIENGTTKCEKYWPNESSNYGQFKVTLKNTSEYPDFIVRTFNIAKKAQQRDIIHYQYLKWPEDSSPAPIPSFIRFLDTVHNNDHYSDTSKPIIVHCSDGCGRTGTTIMIDSLMKIMEAEDSIDLLDQLCLMRKMRMDAVRRYDEYEYVHRVLLAVRRQDLEKKKEVIEKIIVNRRDKKIEKEQRTNKNKIIKYQETNIDDSNEYKPVQKSKEVLQGNENGHIMEIETDRKISSAKMTIERSHSTDKSLIRGDSLEIKREKEERKIADSKTVAVQLSDGTATDATRDSLNFELERQKSQQEKNVIKRNESLRSKQLEVEVAKRASLKFKIIEHKDHLIRNDKFVDYVRQMLLLEAFRAEFDSIPLGATSELTAAMLPKNSHKNRPGCLGAYDHSRVVLKQEDSPNKNSTDYINGNWIDGHKASKRYIATQGPMSTTVHDFWRMVWQNNVKIILMLTKLVDDGTTKCEKYWPEQPSNYGSIRVSPIETESFLHHFVVRKFQLQKADLADRFVTQYHYLGWPESSIPHSTSSIIPFIEKYRSDAHYENKYQPILVHCSNGSGRTGSLILLDSIIQMLDNDESVNALAHLCTIRDQRIDMVETYGQYAYVHTAAIDFLEKQARSEDQSSSEDQESVKIAETPAKKVDTERAVLSNKESNEPILKSPAVQTHPIFIEEISLIVDDMINSGHLKKDFDSVPLGQTAKWDTGKLTQNLTKNRYSTSAAYDHSRVVLDVADADARTQTDYINANWIDGYTAPKRYIATQAPLPGTINDFWRMIWQKKAKIIVMLTKLSENGKSKCAKYYPDHSHEYGKIKVTLFDTHIAPEYLIRKLELQKGKEKRVVVQYHYLGWPDGSVPSIYHFVSFIEAVHADESYSDQDSPIVVHCSGGCGRTGTAILIDSMSQMLRHEEQIDALFQFCILRRARVDTVEEYEQYLFAHQVMVDYYRQNKNLIKRRQILRPYSPDTSIGPIKRSTSTEINKRSSIGRTNTPENRPQTPEIVTKTPEYRTRTPEYRAKTPDLRAKTPEALSRTKTPERSPLYQEYKRISHEFKTQSSDLSPKTPEIKRNTPDYGALIPDLKNQTPEYRSKTPEFRSSTPEFRLKTPEPIAARRKRKDTPMRQESSDKFSGSLKIESEIEESTSNPLDQSHAIKINEFASVVSELMESKHLDKDFDSVPLGQTASWETGKLPENINKNRYETSAAYDHSRVILETENLDDGNETDYINANWIHGYKAPNRYIATQAPLPNTVNDFWRMVWQKNTKIIVMLTKLVDNGKTKCEKYWPDTARRYGTIVVTHLKTDTYPDYVIRKFHAHKGSDSREIIQFHYLGWPDGGVPATASSFLQFLEQIHSDDNYYKSDKPIIVHCSGGCGRTGTTILADSMLEMSENEPYIDVLAHLCVLRKMRVDTVEELQQYLFVHRVITDSLEQSGGNSRPQTPSSRPSSSLRRSGGDLFKYRRPSIIPLKQSHPIPIAELEEYVTRLITSDHLEKDFSSVPFGQTASWDVGKHPENFIKNRDAELAAYDHSRVILDIDNLVDLKETDYINATWMNGHNASNRYISTQGPLPSTQKDFWRMVWQRNAKIIIMVTDLEENGKIKCEKYWPDRSEKYGLHVVTLLKTEMHPDFVVRKFHVHEDLDSREVIQYQYFKWHEGSVPQSSASFLSFLDTIHENPDYSKTYEPIIVHCSNGSGRTGATILIDSMMEMMKTEDYVDMLANLCELRKMRANAVEMYEEYEFVHRVLVDSLKPRVEGVPFYSQIVPDNRFLDYVKQATKKNMLKEDFDSVPLGQTAEWKVGKLPSNARKNRYDTSAAYDNTRVVLEVDKYDRTQTDYINANWIHGYNVLNRYIATQAPLPNTITDFWRMIWQANAKKIIILTKLVDNGKVKCEKYWPDSSEKYGKVTVTLSGTETTPDYVVRRFIINKGNDTRSISQYHYLGWPDGSVPSSKTSFLTFIRKVHSLENPSRLDEPIVVHCSGGCGRTGTTILADSMLHMLRNEHHADVLMHLCLLRQMRVDTVEEYEQYVFVHELIAEYLKEQSTDI